MDLSGFFQPKSIAIIGASRTEGSLGQVFFGKLLNYGYTGKIYPVNPQADEISGIRCYASIDVIPDQPDMAVILVRKDLAISAVESCGQKGIKNIVMITAGFREIGGEGVIREKQLLQVVKKYKQNLIGPNCMGLINTDPEFRMNASFSPTDPFEGNVAFVSQSGALGVAVLEMSRIMHLGFSIFISEGNKAHLADHHFLEYLASHQRTKVVTMYLESIEDGSAFRKIAGTLSRQKPIIAIKAGRSKSGAKAASSHTGALASSERATSALFEKCGILQAQSLSEMFDMALAFSNQPLPKGDQIAVMTNAGGPAILATDAIEKFGLQMANLSKKTKDELIKFLPEEASVDNPVDMIASANEICYQQALKLLLKDTGVDAVLLIIVRPPVNTTPAMIAEKLSAVLRSDPDKPVFIILMAHKDENSGLPMFQKLHLPVYSYPEAAAFSMSMLRKYYLWQKKPSDKIRKIKVNTSSAHSIFEAARNDSREHLRYGELDEILGLYEFPFVKGKIIQSEEEALQVYNEFKSPVVLKIESDEIIHKSDSGCVRVNLKSERDVKKAYQGIINNALKITTPEKISGLLIQEFLTGTNEVALGMKRDPNYGPLIMVGIGGIFIELFKDVIFRLAPLTEKDAWEMIREMKGYPIFEGFRGAEPLDASVIVESLLKLSQLSMDFQDILELDLNPFLVAPQKKNCKIVDARIRIQL
jgi:acetyltransferase